MRQEMSSRNIDLAPKRHRRLLMSIIRFSAHTNYNNVAKLRKSRIPEHEHIIQDFDKLYDIKNSSCRIVRPVTKIAKASKPYEWLLREVGLVISGLHNGDEMVIMVHGRDGLYANPKPWLDLHNATQHLRVFIVFRGTLERMNHEVMTGWRMQLSEFQKPMLWAVFELPRIADCLNGNKAVYGPKYMRLIDKFEYHCTWRASLSKNRHTGRNSH